MAPGPKRAKKPAALDPVALLEACAARQAPPVLLVTGQDYFSREAILADLRKALVAEGFEPFDAMALGGDEVSGDGLVNQAEVLPMGGMAGGSRFLLVRRAEKIRERDLDAIARYAASPTPTTCLVLVFGESKGAVLTALKKIVPALDLPAPRDYQLARWLEAQARRLKIALEPEAARELAGLSGEDYIAAMSHLQQAALHAGSRRISRKMIEDLAGTGHDTNPFHLTDAVLGGEAARAIRILRDLHDAGESGYMILALLEGQLRKFLKMRAAVAQGRPARSVVQAESPMLPPPIQARLARQLERFDEARLIECFRAARAADRAIKSYGSGAELAHLESLLWTIAAPAEA